MQATLSPTPLLLRSALESPVTALVLQGEAGAQSADTASVGAGGAEGSDPLAGEPTGPPEGMGWVPFAVIGALFYFVLIRPQSKEQKRRAAMLSELKKGDEVMTSSGLFGTIASLSDERVTLEVAKGVRLEFSRAAVQGLASEGEAPQDAAGASKEG
jgi:preprotein translocase subunit YajC